MRIAVNARLLVAQPLEGLGRYTLEALRALLALRPDDDFLLVCDRAGDLPALPRPVERVTVGPPARHPVLYYAWLEWAVPRALRRWRADAWLSMDNFASLRAPVPTVLVVHDLAYRHVPEGVGRVDRAYYRRYMPRFARRAEVVVAVSEATRRDLVASYGLDPAGVLVAPNGVRPRFGPLPAAEVAAVRAGLTAGQPYVVAVGSVHPRKNIDGLIRAFGRFCESAPHLTHHLVIVGRMAWRTTAVEAALAASPVRDRIHLTGYVDEVRLGRLIGAAEQLALVSRWEGFGVPIVEALASGVPVVVGDVSSLPEVAGPGGLRVDPRDEPAIAAALGRLAGDADLRRVLAEAGRAHVARYTWAACAKTLSGALERAVRP